MVIQQNAQDLTGYGPANGGGGGGGGMMLPDWGAILFPPGNGLSGWKVGIKFGSVIFPRGRGDTDDPMVPSTGLLTTLTPTNTDTGLMTVVANDYVWLQGQITADPTSWALSVAMASDLTLAATTGGTWAGGEFEHDGGVIPGGGGAKVYKQKYFRIRLGQVKAGSIAGTLQWNPWVLGPLTLQGMWVKCVSSTKSDPQIIPVLAPVPFGGG